MNQTETKQSKHRLISKEPKVEDEDPPYQGPNSRQ